MTSPLRRKRQIIRPGVNRPARTAARRSLIGRPGGRVLATAALFVLAATSRSWAQSPSAATPQWSAPSRAVGMDDSVLHRASMQPPPGGGPGDYGYGQADESEEHRVQLAPPGPERLF